MGEPPRLQAKPSGGPKGPVFRPSLIPCAASSAAAEPPQLGGDVAGRGEQRPPQGARDGGWVSEWKKRRGPLLLGSPPQPRHSEDHTQQHEDEQQPERLGLHSPSPRLAATACC